MLWGTVTVIAILKYLYEIKCSRRRYEETALGSEDPEAESRNSAAEERLLIQLEEATGVRIYEWTCDMMTLTEFDTHQICHVPYSLSDQ